LLESERNALLVFIELENLDVNLIADIYQIARMRESSPGHVGDVQQTIEAAEIDESSVIGEILHRAGEHRTFFQVLECFGAFLSLLFFGVLLARDHDVPALFIQLDYPNFNLLALISV